MDIVCFCEGRGRRCIVKLVDAKVRTCNDDYWLCVGNLGHFRCGCFQIAWFVFLGYYSRCFYICVAQGLTVRYQTLSLLSFCLYWFLGLSECCRQYR